MKVLKSVALILISAVLLLSLFTACNTESMESNFLSGEKISYKHKSSHDTATLTLNTKTGEGQFVYSYLSSHFAVGKYTETETRIVLKCEEGNYTFQKKGDNLIFEAEDSVAMPKFAYSAGTEAEVCLSDGAVFKP